MIYLADTSAWVVTGLLPQWEDSFTSGDVATCPVVELEFRFTAQSSKAHKTFAEIRSNLVSVPLTEKVGTRALDVQVLLSRKNQMGHRSVGPADLLIAACAELAGLTVLHYDKDYDLIAEVTGQPCEWIAPRGSLTG